ncbi:sulfotransferase family protein [Xenococcus sp. PCC 7305]|uniref:sulfotransferase family protein n=1 Tax=Xenococcus sp. PCC 7305 TaxID=102125 RepID=UPI0002ACA77C|nr:sulfotransferase [Xenococcus sp. PCC 7305]ELS01636.1 sulfotransferase family protein [Xenococcus sp. PCC 7305]
MERKVTFLLGTGRCGSTLLQRLINFSPEAIIWGEHGGFLNPISAGYFKVLNNENLERVVYQNPGHYAPIRIVNNREEICSSEISWMNDFKKDALKFSFKEFIESIFCSKLPQSVSCWGFKEILYGKYQKDLSIDMLLEIFPESRNIIIVRHPLDTIVSMSAAWHGQLLDTIKENDNQEDLREFYQLIRKKAEQWSQQNQRLIDYAGRFPDNFIIVKYEDLKSNSLDMIFDFIGLNRPKNIESVMNQKVYQTKTSDRNGYAKELMRKKEAKMWNICEDIALEFGYKKEA